MTHHARGVAREYMIHLSNWVRTAILADWVPPRMAVHNRVLKNKPFQLSMSRISRQVDRGSGLVWLMCRCSTTMSGDVSPRSSIRDQKVTRKNECTGPRYANMSESPAFKKPIQMYCGTMSCQSTAPHAKSAENLSEYREPSCAGRACTPAA